MNSTFDFAKINDIVFDLAAKDMRYEAELILTLSQYAQRLQEQLASRPLKVTRGPNLAKGVSIPSPSIPSPASETVNA